MHFGDNNDFSVKLEKIIFENYTCIYHITVKTLCNIPNNYKPKPKSCRKSC